MEKWNQNLETAVIIFAKTGTTQTGSHMVTPSPNHFCWSQRWAQRYIRLLTEMNTVGFWKPCCLPEEVTTQSMSVPESAFPLSPWRCCTGMFQTGRNRYAVPVSPAKSNRAKSNSKVHGLGKEVSQVNNSPWHPWEHLSSLKDMGCMCIGSLHMASSSQLPIAGPDPNHQHFYVKDSLMQEVDWRTAEQGLKQEEYTFPKEEGADSIGRRTAEEHGTFRLFLFLPLFRPYILEVKFKTNSVHRGKASAPRFIEWKIKCLLTAIAFK